MAEPRFLMVYAATAALKVWPGTWVEASADRRPGADRVSAWRLLGGNNRELGRSFHVYDDPQACLRSAIAVQRATSRGQLLVVAAPRSGRWYWEFWIDGEAIAASARAFAQQRDCHANFAAFREIVAVADVNTLVPKLELHIEIPGLEIGIPTLIPAARGPD